MYFLASIGFFLFTLSSCKKINESSNIGSDLIPAVDNVNTFEAFLEADSTFYSIENDTSKFFYSDLAALGKINDPVFGNTTGDVYFNLSMPAYGYYPFGESNKVVVDSVVLSLSYKGAYGDTTAVHNQTIRVYELAPGADFRSDTSYRFTSPGFPLGLELGSKTFSISALKDSILIVRKDSVKTANVIRIPLRKEFGERITKLDTTAFKTDSAFRSLIKGVAVMAENVTGNGALSYLKLNDQAKTNLTIYFKSTANGSTDSTNLITLTHATNGQANIIHRDNGGEYAANAPQGQSADGKLYIQSTPGSYVRLKIPGLDTLKNKIIHRAELIVTKLASSGENVFTPPTRLYLELRNPAADTAYLIVNDLPVASYGDVDFSTFGGTLRTDNTYHFTLTRHVQAVITRGERNLPFRLYAPIRALNYLPGFTQPLSVSVLPAPSHGRVVVAGDQYANTAQRMRLRIVYSNL